MKAKIKTIDVYGKEWFDKQNGNSYHSVRVVINHGLKNQSVLVAPMQYGYGDSYMRTAGELLSIPRGAALWRYCEANRIILRYQKQDRCLKRDVIAHGTK